MASVTVFTAARMKQIEDSTVVGGAVNPQNRLILTQRDGSQIDAGSVASNAKMAVEDTASVDLTASGNGSDATPFTIKAEVKKIPASAVDSGRFDLARIPDQTLTGVLEAKYRGGPAKVKVNGVLSTQAYGWMTPYQPGASRQVDLLQTGNTWKITGQNESGVYPIELTNLADSYNDGQGVSVFSHRIRSVRLPSGIVVLSGLVLARGQLSNGDIVGFVDPNCRPDKATRLATEFGDISKDLIVGEDGAIRIYGNPIANQYFTLDGMAYPAAGVATWTPLGDANSPFGSNWTTDPTWNALYGVPSYWVDPYGYMWFQGLLKAIGTISSDQIMFKVPASLPVYKNQHVRTAASSVLGAIGTDSATNNVVYKAGGPATAGTWIALSGAPLQLVSSRTLNNWYQPRTFRNSWTNYNTTQFTEFSFAVREDGLRVACGLVGSGTVGSLIVVPKDEEYWPRYGRIILPSFAANARGRIDISPAVETDWTGQYTRGGIVLQQGSNTWYSLDSKMWTT